MVRGGERESQRRRTEEEEAQVGQGKARLPLGPIRPSAWREPCGAGFWEAKRLWEDSLAGSRAQERGGFLG